MPTAEGLHQFINVYASSEPPLEIVLHLDQLSLCLGSPSWSGPIVDSQYQMLSSRPKAVALLSFDTDGSSYGCVSKWVVSLALLFGVCIRAPDL